MRLFDPQSDLAILPSAIRTMDCSDLVPLGSSGRNDPKSLRVFALWISPRERRPNSYNRQGFTRPKTRQPHRFYAAAVITRTARRGFKSRSNFRQHGSELRRSIGLCQVAEKGTAGLRRPRLFRNPLAVRGLCDLEVIGGQERDASQKLPLA